MADQLIRETQPPAGTPASPVPQYRNPETGKYERVEGAHGAPRAILYGPDGQPINASNRLPVDVTGEVSVAGDVSVTGEVDVSDRPGRQLGKVEATLTGTDVPLRGLASERPTASSSNKGYVYWSVDTGDVSVSTGSTWRSLGVA